MSGTNEKALGEAVQRARQAAGLTQQELCNAISLSYSTLAKIERGAIKSPSIFTVYKLAGAIGISMDDLLGAVVDAPLKAPKKTSKSGVSFVYFDVNGCLVRFFHAAFTKLSHETGMPSDVIESAFWHHNDSVCRGDMSLQQFNDTMGQLVGVQGLNWLNYYLDAIEPIEEMRELVQWAAQHYRIGLLTNIMPGFLTVMADKGIIPKVPYDIIVDSSVVGSIKPEPGIYEVAEAKCGVSGSEILFIDDSRTNLMAAEHRGWKVLWFNDYDPLESVSRIKTALVF